MEARCLLGSQAGNNGENRARIALRSPFSPIASAGPIRYDSGIVIERA
jgi:hypothetical protein